MSPTTGTVNILLVEDNPADVRLTREAMSASRTRNALHIARDGEEAMAFLRREGVFSKSPRPDLIILDLNLPKKDGREVLSEVKSDPNFKRIPVIILTTSNATDDIMMCYENHANCYLTKPATLEQFRKTIKLIEDFWLSTARLPPA